MDKRQFLASFSVKVGTRRVRFELADARLFGGAAGLYRVRIDRRWHDAPGGELLLLDRSGLAALLADAALGALEPAPLPPDIPAKSRVSYRREVDGMPRREAAWTTTPPILAANGRYMSAVLLCGGVKFVPCEDLTVREDLP